MYAANINADTVSVIDTSSNTVIATVPTQDQPVGLAVHPDGTRVYAANNGSDSVSVIDATANLLIVNVPVGNGPGGVAAHPDGTRIYVANGGSPDTVSVIDTSAHTVVASIPVGVDPVAFGRFIGPAPPPTPVAFTAFLHGSGGTANPPTLFLDDTAPSGTTAKFKDSPSVAFGGGNPWREVGTWTSAFDGTLHQLDALHVWLGLKNSDDQGTRFDIRAEIYKNSALVSAGETLCITGLTRNPANAQQATAGFGTFPPVAFDGTTDVLSLRVLTRIGTVSSGAFCGGHASALGLRLYFDAVNRDSRLEGMTTP